MKMTKHVYTDEKTASKYLFTGPTYQLINLSSKSKTKKGNERIVLGYGRRKSLTSFTPLWEVFVALNDPEAVHSDWNSIVEEALL